MTGASRLHETQTLFWRLLTAPEGVASGLDELAREGLLAEPDLSHFVRPSPEMSPSERLDVYADMYFYRLKDCLAEDFPKLAEWIGPARFHNLVTDYLLAHPSRHPSLRELGRALPGFLERASLPARFACAPELARFEWARVDVFDDVDATPLTRDALLGQAAADPELFLLRQVPALRLLRVSPGVLALWRGIEDGELVGEVGALTRAASRDQRGVCVWRRDFAIFHRSLAEDEEHCLRASSREPLNLARLGELVLEAQPERVTPTAAGARFAELLERWLTDGIFCPAEP